MGSKAEQIAEQMLEAMSMIAQFKTEQVQFDKTVEAIIEDVSAANLGRYLVSSGNLTFYAFSTDTKYKKNDSVLVMIPQGNYDNQKIIISKKSKNNETIITYDSPLSHLIDITQNLIATNVEQEIWANSNDLDRGHPWNTNVENFEDSELSNTNKMLWSWKADETNEPFSKYTKIGLSAEFATFLNVYGTIEGNYGLALNVIFSSKDNNDAIEKEKEKQIKKLDNQLENNEITQEEYDDLINVVESTYIESTFQKTFLLDSNDFYGNPFGFETYFTQEILYDISDFIDFSIIEITLFLYQRNNFYDAAGELIPTISDEEEIFTDILSNIRVRNPYICLGYDVDTFDKDTALIYTNNSSTYYKTKTDDSQISAEQRESDNQKIIKLRWIHKDDITGKIHLMTEVPEGYEIRWYRHVLGEVSPDQFAGAYYTILEDFQNQFTIVFNPDINTSNEILKVAIIKTTETIGGVYKETLIAMTPLLTFTNDTELPNMANLATQNALGIRFEDDQRGKYYVYGQNNKILNNIDTKQTRYVTAIFDPGYNSIYEKALLLECSSITWYIPTVNTMIQLPTEINNATISIPGDNVYVKYIGELGPYHSSIVSDNEEAYQLPYLIKSYYNRNAINNTIRLEVEKDGIIYTSSVDLQFGISGTAGASYTMGINWILDKEALDVSLTSELDPTDESSPMYLYGTNGDFIAGRVIVYDSTGLPLSIPATATITYSWMVPELSEEHKVAHSYDETINREIREQEEDPKLYISSQNNQVIISCNQNLQLLNKLHILKVNIDNFLDYNLVFYFPIPLKNSALQLEGIDGATYVRYGENGKVEYNSNPYRIFYNNNGLSELTNVIWRLLAPTYQIINQEDTDVVIKMKNNFNSYFPKVTDAANGDFSLPNNVLKPISIFVEAAPDYGVQCFLVETNEETGNTIETVIWSQPILVYQDNVSSTTVSTLGGNGLVISEEYTVENATISTGKKEEDNSYSGIVVGDLINNNTQDKESGIFGFYKGDKTYSLTNSGEMSYNIDNKNVFSLRPYGIWMNSPYCNVPFPMTGDNSDQYGMLFNLTDTSDASGRVHGTLSSSSLYDRTNAVGSYGSTRISSMSPYFQVNVQYNTRQGGNITSSTATMFNISDLENYLQSRNFSTSVLTGSKIDLNTGNINSYNYSLSAENATNNSRITYSSSDTYPMSVSINNSAVPDFAIGWGGTLTARAGGTLNNMTITNGSIEIQSANDIFSVANTGVSTISTLNVTKNLTINNFQNTYSSFGLLDNTDENNIKVGINANDNIINLKAKQITLTLGETIDNPAETTLENYIVNLIQQHVKAESFVED